MTKICYLDFDGVLHSDQVYVSSALGIHMEARGRALLEWAPILDELLAPYPDISIVLSTTWVAQFSFEFARDVLPEGLQKRVIGATYGPENLRYFDAWPRGRQVTSDVQVRKPDAWFALDDDSSGWPASATSHVIQTVGATGISSLSIQAAIVRTLNRW
jgi:hypothetical protein